MRTARNNHGWLIIGQALPRSPAFPCPARGSCVYTRDHYVYGYASADEVPALNAVFVLSLSGIDDGADIYNQLRDQLGVFVEPSIIHSDIEIEGGDL
ncbi:hypothetical protein J3E64_001358 [Sphingobium sp. OAS761]|uniref:hypothetical protein n=1 Tax=Sphingobium sp. OAS761 TaxID=2817901 RepID=UPI00209EE29E|nr:hypothetical protein [Sphingobium sp. OAS761]MCP1469676.1 hypothetical protein [Sphingobium sp. OAS761]